MKRTSEPPQDVDRTVKTAGTPGDDAGTSNWPSTSHIPHICGVTSREEVGVTQSADDASTSLSISQSVEVSEDASSSEIFDPILDNVAGWLGEDWKELAPHLGFKPADISTFEANNPRYFTLQTLQMLHEWRQRHHGTENHMDVLCGALATIGRNDIVECLQGSSILMPEPTDESLRKISSSLGRQWTELASQLGFTHAQINAIEREYPASTVDNFRLISNMLVEWRRRISAGTDWRDVLGTALRKTGRSYIAIGLIQLGSYERMSGETDESPMLPASRAKTIADQFENLLMQSTDGDRLGKKLQLPYMAIGYFNENGGSLNLDKYDVHLTIPRGAIASGPPKQVYIYVDPTARDGTESESREVGLSQVIQCGPPGITLHESVLLSFPHQVVKPSEHCHLLSVRMRKGVNSSEAWEEFDGDVAVINEKRVILLLKHFSWWQLIIAWFFKNRLMVGVFGDVFHPSYAGYGFRVHVWKDVRDSKKRVLDMEKQSERLDVPKYLGFSSGEGDIQIEVSKIDEGWHVRPKSTQIISNSNIKNLPANSVTFALKKSKRTSDLYCEIHVSQRSDTPIQQPVFLMVNPKNYRYPEQDPSVAGASNQMSAPPIDSDSDMSCWCSEIKAGICPLCQQKMADAASAHVHGEAAETLCTSFNFGGLSKDTRREVCEYLDGDNWKKLAEHLTNKGCHFIHKAKKLDHPTKVFLKVYFENYGQMQWENRKMIQKLVLELEDLKLHNVAEIIRKAMKKKKNMPLQQP